ncbi:MAG: RHS repeat-associated core domain-containing protein [Rhizomicrobium sp.]
MPNGSRKLPGNACDPYGDLSQYAFTLTEPDRTVASFAFFCTERLGNADDIGAIPQYQVARTGWNLTHIAYPAGTSVDLTYTVPPTADGVESSWWPLLTDVSNSLGRHLTLAYAAAPGAGVMTVSDATDPAHPRTATFDGVACKASPWLKQSDYTAPCSTLFGAVHDPEGNTTTYDYIRQWDGGQATDMLAASGQFSQFVGDNLPWQMPAHLAAIHLPASTAAADYAFAYDEIGRLRSATDAEGHVWQYRIANGRRGEIVDPLSGHTVSLFDPNAREVADIDALGRLSTMAYDGLGRLTAKTGPEGIREDTLYDARNNPIRTTRHAKPGSGLADLATSATYHATCNVPLTETDARGATVTHTIDNATCLETARTDPAVAGGAPVTSWTYNGLGQVLTETDPTGLRTRYTYNGSHYLASVIASDGALNLTTSFGYDAAGNVTSLTDPRSNTHTAAYDRNRRIAEWDAPLGAVTQWTYDPTGLLLTLKRATGNGGAPWATTGFTYWPTGKVHTSTDPDGAVTVTEHDALGRASKVTDPMGRAVSTTYDLIGEVLQERHAAGTASEIVYATHTWSPDGKELSVADANGNLTAYAYDGFDRMARQTYPSPTTAGLTDPADYESFVYDANGNVTGHRIRGGVTITSTYDALDRLIRRLVPAFGAQGADVTTATAYDRAGRETAVSDTLGNTIVSTYDTAGRLATVATTVPGVAGTRTVSYQYDAASNPTRLTWPDGYYVQYGFDAQNRMSTASENGMSTLATYSYDPLSQPTGIAYGNGTNISYGYSPAGDLASLVHDLAGTANDAITTLTYNLAHQLAGESVTNPAWRLASPATGSTTYVPNGLNQYASVGGAGLTYDADGNLTTDGAWTYGYDGENRLLVAKTAGTLAVYAYDPRGRRTAKAITVPAAPLWGTAVWGAFTWTAAATTTTSFLHDGDNEIAEYDGAGALIRRFVPGPAVDQPIAMVAAAGTRTYVHANRQGSVVTMSDASGAPAEGPYAYDAYGTCMTAAGAPCATPTSTTIPFRYTGRYLDAETGLYYYRARYYSSAHGRFLQTDSIGYQADFNLYAYVRNDPSDKADPSGKDPFGNHLPENYGCWGSMFCASTGEVYGIEHPHLAKERRQEIATAIDVLLFLATLPQGGEGAVGRIVGEKVVVSLGHFPTYLKVAERYGYKAFSIPPEAWDALGNDAARWAVNRAYLDAEIAAGARFRLSTTLRDSDNFYRQELEYLNEKGYTPSADGEWLDPPKPGKGKGVGGANSQESGAGWSIGDGFVVGTYCTGRLNCPIK